MSSDRPSRRAFLQAGRSRTSPVDISSDSIPDSTTDSYLLHFARPAMGCEFEVLLNADEDHTAADAALRALDQVAFLEGKLSLYQPHSDLCRVNRLAARTPQHVDDDIWQNLLVARELHVASDGAFDITSTPLWRLWGFHQREGRLPEADAIRQVVDQIGMQHVELDEEQCTVAFGRPGIELNLGSLGKGYALDTVHDLLSGCGVENFLVHGGYSSMLARGRRIASASPGEGWSVALRDPDRPERRLGRILLRDMAIGTSGLANQSFIHRGRRYGHLLDPRTGYPVEHLVSATALCPSGLKADGLATAFFVMGVEGARAYCERAADTGAILVAPGAGPGRREVIVLGTAERYWIPDE